MSGYKRVNYYELCRLCTSTEGPKVHIFKEEGRRRQLPSKIKRCLPLKVFDNDLLPKMICRNCIVKLDEIDNYRQLCTEAEKMLQDFRATLKNVAGDDDVALQVYVKDSQSQIIEPKKLPTYESIDHSISAPEESNSNCEPERQNTSHIPVPSKSPEELRPIQCTVPLKLNGTTSVPVNFENISSLMQVVPNNDLPRIQQFKLPIQSKLQMVGEAGTPRFSVTLPSIDAVAKDDSSLLQTLQCAVNCDTLIDIQKIQSSIATSNVSFNNTVTVPLIPTSSATIVQNDNVQDCTQITLSREEPNSKSCSHCGKILTSPNEVCNHTVVRPVTSPFLNGGEMTSTTVIQTVEPKSSNKSVKRTYSEASGFKCDICEKPFRKKEHLFQHRKLHSGDRPYVCGSCGKSFSRKEHLFRHMLAHTGEKRHACNYCGKTFSRKDNLHKHRKIHGVNGPYECELCGKSFIVQHYFLMHKANHCNSDGEELPYHCDICKKGFVKEEFLNRHKVRHRSRNVPQVEETDLSTLNPVTLLSPNMVQQNLCIEETVYVSTEPSAYSISISEAANTTTATQTSLTPFSADLTTDGQLLDNYRQFNSTIVSS